jgi:hypothetical protein
MSTIGSRPIDELEQEYQAQRKKMREREVARDAKTERNIESVVKKKDSQLESAVRNVKDTYESKLKDEGRLSRAERDRLQKEIYDRSGRKAAAIAENANVERDRAMEHAEQSERHYDRAVAETEAYSERRASEIAEAAAKDREELVDSYRRQLAEARATPQEERSATNAYREKIRREADEAVRRLQSEVTLERDQSRKSSEILHKQMSEREKKSDDLLASRLREKNAVVGNDLERRAVAERISRTNEIAPLREQLNASANLKREGQAAKNQARADSYKEHEDEWYATARNQQVTHDLEKKKLKAEMADIERVYGEKHANYVRDKDAASADTVHRAYQDAHEEKQRLVKAYEESLDQAEKQIDADRDYFEKRSENKSDVANDTLQKALAKQAAAYQKTMANQRQTLESQMGDLERVLQAKSTTDQPGEISPAAEEHLRAQVSAHYEKKFGAETQRNADAREHLTNSYEEKLAAERNTARSGAEALNRQNSTEQTLLRHQYVAHIMDVEDSKRRAIDAADYSSTRQSDAMVRNHERAMNDFRRHYDGVVADRETESSSRIQEVMAKADFERQNARREFANQMQDTTRTYEKRLAEQKDHYEAALGEMKAKLDTANKEHDRQLRQALADQARSYDHRIAETEAQIRDRERNQARLHEEELDKVKKSNALLLSKKG